MERLFRKETPLAKRKSDDGKTYTLKGFDPKLWKRFRLKCLRDGTTIKARLSALIAADVRGQLDVK